MLLCFCMIMCHISLYDACFSEALNFLPFLRKFMIYRHLHLLFLDNDDVAMMDMVDMKGGDLTQDRPLTGSCAKVPMAEEYSLES